MGSVMKSLDNKDNVNRNTRLSDLEIGSLLTSEGLQDVKILKKDWFTLPTKFKEMKVSLNGLGREEKVRIIAGEREHKQGGGFFSGLTNMFQKRQ